MPTEPAVQTQSGDATLDDDRDGIADPEHLNADGTLVLVGCGSKKRYPEDPVHLQKAVVSRNGGTHNTREFDEAAWHAQDLYTSTYFAAKREFAETVTRSDGTRDPPRWAILSAEHDILWPRQVVARYDTSIDDLGGDPENPDHQVNHSYSRRRPDGREIVTERDQWATLVAYGLCSWLSAHRERLGEPHTTDANTLLVLAGQSYIEPLRERGVFDYGISRMTGDPNRAHELDVNVRFLFEEIDAGGNGEQMAWLSDAVSRLESARDPGEQAALGEVADAD